MGQIIAKLLMFINPFKSSKHNKAIKKAPYQTSQPSLTDVFLTKASSHQVEQDFYDQSCVITIPREEEYQETSESYEESIPSFHSSEIVEEDSYDQSYVINILREEEYQETIESDEESIPSFHSNEIVEEDSYDQSYLITIPREEEYQETSESQEESIPSFHSSEIVVEDSYDQSCVITIPREEEYQETSEGQEESIPSFHSSEIVEDSAECIITIPSSCGVGVQLQPKKREIWIKYYSSSHKILLVGDGDFSFSACLAKAFGSAANMVATSLDSLEFLTKHYSMAMSNINYLKNNGGIVRHNFDATEMWNNRLLIVDSNTKFDRIVYNFPLAGFFPHLTREHQLQRHQSLIRSFMRNARKMIEDDGEIHITHKSHGFFLDWDLADLARRSCLKLIEDVQFNLRDYPGYRTKYGFGGDRNFRCHPSRTYKFSLDILYEDVCSW